MSFRLAYMLSDFEFRDFSDKSINLHGKKIPGIPQNHLFAEIRWKGSSGLFALLKGKYVDELFADRLNTVTTPNYFIADFQIGFKKKWGEFVGSFFLGLENAADWKYFANTRIDASRNAFFEPGPPLSLGGGFQISFRKQKSSIN